MAHDQAAKKQSSPSGTVQTPADDQIDEAGRESFPASDPPAHSVLREEGASATSEPPVRTAPKSPKKAKIQKRA